MNLLPSILNLSNKCDGAKSELILDGVSVPVEFKTNHLAKRIILRMNKKGAGIVLTLPMRTTKKRALEFAASQGVWIAGQLANQPDHISFIDGQIIPIRAVEHQICASQSKRTPVWVEATDNEERPKLCVSGASEHHERRIRDWLKKQARSDLHQAAHFYADKMGKTIKRICVRDTTSRWGSCSSDGALSFSWRLILAPDYVLDYVCAHEAAHLIEMNHSPDFWTLVEEHCADTQRAKRWLKDHGRTLHTYGR